MSLAVQWHQWIETRLKMSKLIIIEGLPEETFNLYWGGEDRGLSLQITLSGEDWQKGYIQLSSKQIYSLIARLAEELTD